MTIFEVCSKKKVASGLLLKLDDDYMVDTYGLGKADLKEFEKHYSTTAKKSTRMKAVSMLADQVHGLYDDIWEAYYNGRRQSWSYWPIFEPV